MSGQPRPWWASDGPVDGGVDPTQDPVDTYRAARRGGDHDALPWWAGEGGQGADPTVVPLDAATRSASPADDTGAAASQRAAPEADHHGDEAPGPTDEHADDASAPRTAEHRPELCGVCPICTGFRLLEEVRPELAHHLAEATRHLAAALRDLAEHPPTSRRRTDTPHGDTPPPVQRIDLD